MKFKSILSLILAVVLVTSGSIVYVVASEHASLADFVIDSSEVSTDILDEQNYTILEGASLGNTYHRLNSKVITENGLTYIRLTPTTEALVPKVDRYSLNMAVGEYNYMKVMYKTTVDNSVPFFNVMNGTGITLLESFKPTPADEWVSAIIAINTTDSAVLNQYHFSIFGEATTANSLQGEEFCLAYIGFFKYYDDAVNYQSDISGTVLATEGLGEAYCITSDVFADNISSLSDPDNSFAISFDTVEGALKATGISAAPTNGKIQFRASALTGIPFVKDEYNYVKIRYKYDILYDGASCIAQMREGYSTESTLHTLYSLPEYMSNVWYESVARIIWGTAANGYDTLTFIPMKGDGITNGDCIYIDYISFFATENQAQNYERKANEAIILTDDSLVNSANAPFDPDGILSFSDNLEEDGSYRMTFTTNAFTGKMQFDVRDISGKSINKNIFKFMKIRYKHSISDIYARPLNAALREGHSAGSSLHTLFTLGAKDVWHEEIVEIKWGTTQDSNNTLTFHPIRQGTTTETGLAQTGDEFSIDYIGFYQSRENAEGEHPELEPIPEPEPSPEPVRGNLEILLSGRIRYTKTENDTEITTEYIYKPEKPANIEDATDIKYIVSPVFGNIVVWKNSGKHYYNFGVTASINGNEYTVTEWEFVGALEGFAGFAYNVVFTESTT